MSVLIETTVGDIVVDLFVKERPKSCFNFVKLCKINYYNHCQFFSIQNNFIAQTGDPGNDGKGGTCIDNVVNKNESQFMGMEMFPKLRHLRKGTISFINGGNDMIGSQFYFTLADNLDYLDNKHCVFGHVVEGLGTLEKLNATVCAKKTNIPLQDIRIAHTIILDDPFKDPKGLVIRPEPIPTMDFLKTDKIPIDEEIDEEDQIDEKEMELENEKMDVKTAAEMLELIGDLHDANEKPPDNVLFICKLNPVTNDDDLRIIFSRFGTIIDCEVVRDKKRGESLQYAFIAFESDKECEAAYSKMDNVIIDDRRIHVDFSQSVSKNYMWRKQSRDGRYIFK
uniref:Peptidyl-prolyl cis-trans isomerase n=1 Tax=Rhabditophanes sp. KR3021 TaxID=114890 RepID=A0AC35TXV6_9BILA